MLGKNGFIFPKFSGWKLRKYLKCHHPGMHDPSIRTWILHRMAVSGGLKAPHSLEKNIQGGYTSIQNNGVSVLTKNRNLTCQLFLQFFVVGDVWQERMNWMNLEKLWYVQNRCRNMLDFPEVREIPHLCQLPYMRNSMMTLHGCTQRFKNNVGSSDLEPFWMFHSSKCWHSFQVTILSAREKVLWSSRPSDTRIHPTYWMDINNQN